MSEKKKNLPSAKTKEKLLNFLKTQDNDKYQRIINTIQVGSRPASTNKSIRDRAGL